MNKSAQPDEDADWSQATPGVDYLCFDLYMRMQNPRKIYITETSALTPLDSVLTRDNETNKSSNPSTYGNFQGLYDWRNKIFRKQRRRYIK